MKKILLFVSILLLSIPFLVFGAFGVGWNATSTDTSWISPNYVNGNPQAVRASYFMGTSTTASSTFANGLDLTGGCYAVEGVCLDSSGATLINIQTFTANDTYIPTAGVTVIEVFVTGGGGGGGGARTGDTTAEAGAGGGGSGGTTIKRMLISDLGGSAAVIVGSGGVGGTGASGGNGSNGGSSSFFGTITADGGIGGTGVDTDAGEGVSGGQGATASATGDIDLGGGDGGGGSAAVESPAGGVGGSSYWGGGGTGGAPNGNASDSGKDAKTYGAGGGGAASEDLVGSADGGDGAGGVVVVTEYGDSSAVGLNVAGLNGYVQFNAGSGSLGGSPNLFWDNSNNRLGIGTTSPYAPLSVVGNAVATGTLTVGDISGSSVSTSTIFGNLVITNTPYMTMSQRRASLIVGQGNLQTAGIGSLSIGDGSSASPVSATNNFIRSTGPGSIAAGLTSTAGISTILSSGNGSFAHGWSNQGTITASGIGSTAVGRTESGSQIISSGSGSFAMGRRGLRATGDGSMAFGYATGLISTTTEATATNAIALGNGVIASGASSVAIGRFFTNSTANSLRIGFPTLEFSRENPIFNIIGNSNIGIGTTSPYEELSVGGTVVMDNFIATTTTNSSTKGSLGIGSTTPYGKLGITGTSGSPLIPVLNVASSTERSVFNVDGNGHITTGGSTPTVSSCGTGPSVDGNDTAGTVTVGSGVVLSCDLIFSSPRAKTPRVVGVVTGGGLNIVSGYSAKSTTGVTFSFGSTVGSGTFDYYIVE